MELRQALGIGPGTVAAFVGGGGKTALILALVEELSRAGLRVIFTTTTKIYPPVMETALLGEYPLALARVRGWLEAGIPCCVAQRFLPEGKLAGIDPERVVALRECADVVLVEADGSRGLPLKFPIGAEPVIPDLADLVVPVAGADGVGLPLGPESCHRYEDAAAFWGCPLGELITPAMVARLLWDPAAATRGRPPLARVVPVINKVDSPERAEAARAIAGELLALGAARVVLAAAQAVELRSRAAARPLPPLQPKAQETAEAGVAAAAGNAEEQPAEVEPESPLEVESESPEVEAESSPEVEADSPPEVESESPQPPAAAMAAAGRDPVMEPMGPVQGVLGPVAGLVLAAGSSRRFGPANKLLHPVAGVSLLERSLAAPLGAGLREVMAVTGADAEAVESVLARYPVRVVHNPDHERGMATSLQAGLAALFPADAPAGYQPPAAVMIFLADQPNLRAADVERLIQAWRETGAAIVAPVWRDRWRNPVLFAAALVPELMAVTGDEGGRRVVRAHQDDLVTVPFAAGESFRDIDTPHDLPQPAAREG